MHHARYPTRVVLEGLENRMNEKNDSTRTGHDLGKASRQAYPGRRDTDYPVEREVVSVCMRSEKSEAREGQFPRVLPASPKANSKLGKWKWQTDLHRLHAQSAKLERRKQTSSRLSWIKDRECSLSRLKISLGMRDYSASQPPLDLKSGGPLLHPTHPKFSRQNCPTPRVGGVHGDHRPLYRETEQGPPTIPTCRFASSLPQCRSCESARDRSPDHQGFVFFELLVDRLLQIENWEELKFPIRCPKSQSLCFWRDFDEFCEIHPGYQSCAIRALEALLGGLWCRQSQAPFRLEAGRVVSRGAVPRPTTTGIRFSFSPLGSQF